jgi:hypothetical protein
MNKHSPVFIHFISIHTYRFYRKEIYMVIRTILLSVAWSFLTVLSPLSPVHDSLRPAFADESPKQASSSIQSPEIRSFNSSVRVQKIPFPVLLSKGPPQRMAGFLFWDPSNFKNCQQQRPIFRLLKCIKDRSLKNRTLQVLVHGFTYNHTHWDPPKKKLPSFSYARFMAQQGYPVLALDLLGTGESSIPDGDVLNITESVSSLAQVLTAARSLSNPLGRDFTKIVLVGHSVGTAIAVTTTGTFPGIADFLVATGWSFSPHVVPLSEELIAAALANPLYPLSRPS